MNLCTAIALLSSGLFLSGCAVQMKVDPVQIANNSAELSIESPDLKKWKWYSPVPGGRHVDVTLSKFQGCGEDNQKEARRNAIGKATLTTMHAQQIAEIPGAADLAFYVDSSVSLSNITTVCGMALRFKSEPGKHYVLTVTPQYQQCDMDVVLSESVDGTRRAVSGTRYAVSVYQGFWNGSDLKFCAK